LVCRELVYELHKRGKEVYLISGGFKSIIEPIARNLDIPTSNVYANKLKFFYDGKLLDGTKVHDFLSIVVSFESGNSRP
jgi:phosphoserine phosphatase